MDFNSAKGVWGRQLGNIPQANIGDILYLPTGCSLNPLQMQQFYTIISALTRRNQCTTKIFCRIGLKELECYTHKVTINKQNLIGRQMRPYLATFLLQESYHNFTHSQATRELASIVPVVALRIKFLPSVSTAVPIPTPAEISSMTQRPMKNMLPQLRIGIPKTNNEMKALLMNHYYPTSNLIYYTILI